MEIREEDRIVSTLVDRFPALKELATVVRTRRISVSVTPQRFMEVFAHLIREMGFDGLSGITGVDEGDAITAIYHLHRANSIVLNLKTRLERNNPTIDSVTRFFTGADLYERELADLLGVTVTGLATGRRYPLPEDWPAGEHPLRRDWKQPDAAAPPPADPEEK